MGQEESEAADPINSVSRGCIGGALRFLMTQLFNSQ